MQTVCPPVFLVLFVCFYDFARSNGEAYSSKMWNKELYKNTLKAIRSKIHFEFFKLFCKGFSFPSNFILISNLKLYIFKYKAK